MSKISKVYTTEEWEFFVYINGVSHTITQDQKDKLELKKPTYINKVASNEQLGI